MEKEETMRVRNCLEADIPGVLALMQSVKLSWEPADNEAAYCTQLAHDPESILVLEYKGALIGAVIWVYAPWASFLFHLAIASEYQGKGYARFLEQGVERRAQARGTTSMHGYVLPANAQSLKFFGKRGYTITCPPCIPIYKVL